MPYNYTLSEIESFQNMGKTLQVGDVRWKHLNKVKRGGCIIHVNDQKLGDLFCLGIDRHGQFSDFGGRFDRMVDKSIFDTILREFTEETYSSLSSVASNNISSMNILLTKLDAIVIIQLFGISYSLITCLIQDAYTRNLTSGKYNVETFGIGWFTTNELIKAISGKPIESGDRTVLFDQVSCNGLIRNQPLYNFRQNIKQIMTMMRLGVVDNVDEMITLGREGTDTIEKAIRNYVYKNGRSMDGKYMCNNGVSGAKENKQVSDGLK